jgi:phosphoglycerol transferase MdoB-like AlkP superfamily enzyme
MNTKKKSILFVLLLVSLMVLAIMGWHWTDLANTPFWWTFWVVAAIAAIPAFILTAYFFGKSKNK